MDQLIELLQQIQELAGMGIEALENVSGGAEEGAPPPPEGGGGPPPEGPPPEGPPPGP
jgi:hypothetical protein